MYAVLCDMIGARGGAQTDEATCLGKQHTLFRPYQVHAVAVGFFLRGYTAKPEQVPRGVERTESLLYQNAGGAKPIQRVLEQIVVLLLSVVFVFCLATTARATLALVNIKQRQPTTALSKLKVISQTQRVRVLLYVQKELCRIEAGMEFCVSTLAFPDDIVVTVVLGNPHDLLGVVWEGAHARARMCV